MYINPRIVMLEAKAAGFKLYDVSYGTDPLILYDQRGHILKIWDRYKPTMAEIATTCRSIPMHYHRG